MAKLWDRLRRRLGGGDEHQSDPVHVRTEVAERPAHPDRADTPTSPSHFEPEVSPRNQYATPTVSAPRFPEPPEAAPPAIIPQWWAVPAAELEQRTHDDGRPQGEPQPHAPQPQPQPQPADEPRPPAAPTRAPSELPRPSALAHSEAGLPVAGSSHTPAQADAAHPFLLPPELLPLAPSVHVTDAAPAGTDLAEAFDGANISRDTTAPCDETLAELADFAVVDGAPEAADSEPLPYAQPDTAPAGTGPAGADVAAGSSEAVDADEDDDRNHDTSGAHIRDIALHGAGLRSRRKRGQRGEPDELDGQPARLVLPGRPLKRNEVPTVDTPLLVWSHDPSGEVLVRPVLYACVETQWYGSSLYFLVIPWSERDAPDRSARLVVDATQLRVAPPEMAR